MDENYNSFTKKVNSSDGYIDIFGLQQ